MKSKVYTKRMEEENTGSLKLILISTGEWSLSLLPNI